MVKEQVISDNQFQELLDAIQGSNKTLTTICSDFGFEEEDLTEDQLDEIDATYVHCPCCGWWVEAGEMVDEEHCTDCCEDEEDYDEWNDELDDYDFLGNDLEDLEEIDGIEL